MKLTVIMANTWTTYGAIVFENEWRPYGRRTVQIELTPEQVEAINPREVGWNEGKPVYEIILQSWLEDDAAGHAALEGEDG